MLETFDWQVCGVPVAEARQIATADLLRLAVKHSGMYLSDLDDFNRQVDELSPCFREHFSGKVVSSDFQSRTTTDKARPSARFYVSGHQPELFHPGVWFKNFLLSELSKQPNAIAINFLVDHDVPSSIRVSVPTMTESGTFLPQVFPGPTSDLDVDFPAPWENMRATNPKSWLGFLRAGGQSALRHATSGNDPCLLEMLPTVERLLDNGCPIGYALAAARHRLERENGSFSLEVPLSHIASKQVFGWFAFEIFRDIRVFSNSFSECRRIYREVHGIKNSAHPVAELTHEVEGDTEWIESPFWYYERGSSQRHAIFVSPQGDDRFELKAGDWRFSFEGPCDAGTVSLVWKQLAGDGVCIRPRVLMTSLFAKLFLSDLFIHGIGGAKYDQLTDFIVERWLGLETPQHAVATATVQLRRLQHKLKPPAILRQFTGMDTAIGNEVSGATDLNSAVSTDPIGYVRYLKQLKHRMHFAPEKFLDANNERGGELANRKRVLLEKIPNRPLKRAWHQQIEKVNSELRELIADQISATEKLLDEWIHYLRPWKAAHSREYSIGVFSRKQLMGELSSMAAQAITHTACPHHRENQGNRIWKRR